MLSSGTDSCFHPYNTKIIKCDKIVSMLFLTSVYEVFKLSLTSQVAPNTQPLDFPLIQNMKDKEHLGKAMTPSVPWGSWKRHPVAL